jgi:hypothetical protein
LPHRAGPVDGVGDHPYSESRKATARLVSSARRLGVVRRQRAVAEEVLVAG